MKSKIFLISSDVVSDDEKKTIAKKINTGIFNFYIIKEINNLDLVK